jgi:SAM-dependent methyltransferase
MQTIPTVAHQGQVASKEEVLEFLAKTHLDAYTSVPLPHGLRTPGIDRSRTVDRILGDRIKGRSLLDVGTFYGLFPCEAMRRGAAEAVGVELNPPSYEIAKRIAELHGNAYTIIQGSAEEIDLGRTFDVVTFLNVLHHVFDPIAVIRNLAKSCSDTMIVEFALAPHPAAIRYSYNTSMPRLFRRLHAGARYLLLRAVSQRWPLIAVVGNQGSQFTYFFSKEAFYNVFVLHHKIFSEIEFLPSLRRYRTIAVCKVRR